MANIQALLNLIGGQTPAVPEPAAGLRSSPNTGASAENFEQVLNRVSAQAQQARENEAHAAPSNASQAVVREQPQLVSRAPAGADGRQAPTTAESMPSTVPAGDPSRTRETSVQGTDNQPPTQLPAVPGEAPAPEGSPGDPEEVLNVPVAEEKLLKETIEAILSGAGLEKLLNLLSDLSSMEPEKAADLVVAASGGSISKGDAKAFLKALEAWLGTPVQPDQDNAMVLNLQAKPVHPGMETVNLVQNAGETASRVTEGSNPADPTTIPVGSNIVGSPSVPAGSAPVEASTTDPTRLIVVGEPVEPGAASPKHDSSEGVQSPVTLQAGDEPVIIVTGNTGEAARSGKTVRELLLLLTESKAGRVILQSSMEKPVEADPQVPGPVLVQNPVKPEAPAIPPRIIPVETAPFMAIPAETVPVGVAPVKVVPIETSPARIVPVETTPARLVPVMAEPAMTVPAWTATAQPAPVLDEPAQTVRVPVLPPEDIRQAQQAVDLRIAVDAYEAAVKAKPPQDDVPSVPATTRPVETPDKPVVVAIQPTVVEPRVFKPSPVDITRVSVVPGMPAEPENIDAVVLKPVEVATAQLPKPPENPGEIPATQKPLVTIDPAAVKPVAAGSSAGPAAIDATQAAQPRAIPQAPMALAAEVQKVAGNAVNENAAKNVPVIEPKGARITDLPLIRSDSPTAAPQTNDVKPAQAVAVTAVTVNTGKANANLGNPEREEKIASWSWDKPVTSQVNTTFSVAGKTQPAASAPLSTIDPTDLVQQISGQVKAQLMKGHSVSRLSLQLIPESLGRVTIQVAIVDQTVSARILVASPEVKDVLQRHMVELRTSLNQAGLQIDQLQVHVQGGSGQTLAQYYRYQQEGFASDLRGLAANVVEPSPLEAVADESHISWGRLNLVDVLV